MNDKRSKIRELNDRLRCQHQGGRIHITPGIIERGSDFIAALDQALNEVTFDAENDPYDEHEFGALIIENQTVFFKIDYYDQAARFASPDSSDEHVTLRVMTLMLAEEY